MRRNARVWIALLAVGALAAGCAVRPAGEEEERQNAQHAGYGWEEEQVEIPPLPETPTLDDYLQHAFLANADLQARYWQWRAAIEQIPQDASWPRVALTFGVLFSRENMKFWDRGTLGLANDPMTNIPLPSKLRTAGRKALEDARAAGARFQAAKFQLQGRVYASWYDLALLGESIRIQEETVSLLKLVVQQAGVRISSGQGDQSEALRLQTDLDLAQNDLENLRSQVAPMVARFNALLGREATDPVPLPKSLPAPRPLPVSDDEIIRIGSERNPELAALAREVAGRQEALELARQARLPEFSLSASLTGTIAQNLGGMVVLPTRIAAIRAGIAQAQANLRAAEAARHQYQRDLAAGFILNLYVLRNDERQIALFEKTLLPRAQQTIPFAESGYTANRVSFADLVDTQRAILSTRLTLAQLRVDREKSLAAIEAEAAVDVETLAEGRGPTRAVTP